VSYPSAMEIHPSTPPGSAVTLYACGPK